jgi:mannose-6-phosphate isomerase-like protein (cupin superfamily)
MSVSTTNGMSVAMGSADSSTRQAALQRSAASIGAEMASMLGGRGARSVAGVARRTGIQESALRRVLAGTQPMTVEQALLICDAIDVPLAHFLGPHRVEAPTWVDRIARGRAGSAWRVTQPRSGSHPVEHVLAPGASEAGARHDGMEWIYVVEGAGLLMLDGDGRGGQLYPRDMVEFDASIRHRIVNTEREPLVLLRHMSAAGLQQHRPADAPSSY